MSSKTRKRVTNDEESIKPDDPKNGEQLLDTSPLFPVGKVKASLQGNKDVGTVRKPVEKLLDCCAGLFLQKLIKEASSSATTESDVPGESRSTLIQLQHVQAVGAKYDFVADELELVDDRSAPKAGLALQKAKKRRICKVDTANTKLPTSLAERDQVQQIVDQQQRASSISNQATTAKLEVIEDEEDYD